MVQCEMCGAETSSPKTVKVEGAELDVCDDCTDFGTEVRTQESSTASTKYSTSSSSGGSSGSDSSGSSGSSTRSTGGGGGRRSDMFDEMDEIDQEYDEVIRTGREAEGLTQEELAKQLNEKASLIRKLEQGKTLPSDDVREKLESALGIDLSAGGSSEEDADWDGSSSAGTTTLGDVVERKD